jgi:hypothetical protein
VGILMVSADTGNGLGLLIRAKCVSPCFASEDSIVAVKSLDIDAALGGFSYKAVFAGQRIVAAQGNLMVDLDETRSRVVKDGSANVLRH